MSLQTFEFDALGTHWWLEFLQPTSQAVQLEVGVLKTVADFEQNYSRFRSDSLLSVLNDIKQFKNPPAEFVCMLQYALKMYKSSEGLFNISVGSVLEKNGYGQSAKTDTYMSTNLQDDIDIRDDLISVRPHIRLDFGGFGKGWLIDVLGKQLCAKGCPHFVINGGGDILVSARTPVQIALEHPYDESLMIGTVQVQSGALASSSPLKRAWKNAGKVHHHLLHATNEDVKMFAVCGFVRADTALQADVLSTLLLLADAPQRQRFAQQFTVEYLQVLTDMTTIQSPRFDATLN